MNNRSILRFNRYIVKEIVFNSNTSYDKNGRLMLDYTFDSNTKTNSEKNKMQIELSAHIFKDAERNNFPFEMRVCLVGDFELETEQENIIDFEANAIAILFPYLRALVSTYTANVNINPVILPAMNINAFLKNSSREISL